MRTPHLLLNPSRLTRAVGFSHVVVAGSGRSVFLGGQTGHRPDGGIDDDLVAQFGQAAENVAIALEAAGAGPGDLVSMQIYATDAEEYRGRLEELGVAYRRVFGRHYPATSFFEVAGLFDPSAKVELVCTAVVPHQGSRRNTSGATGS